MTTRAVRRIVAGVLTAVALVLTAVAVPAAHADTAQLLSCVGSGSNTYQPGVTATPGLVTVSSRADYGPCVSTGSPQITSGHFAVTGAGIVSCFAGSFAITVTITWNTGETSTITAVGIVAQRPANEVVVVYQGTVTAGRFLGGAVVMTAALLNTTPELCFTPQGVTGTSGPATILITQVA
jgi:hypothetical protein